MNFSSLRAHKKHRHCERVVRGNPEKYENYGWPRSLHSLAMTELHVIASA
jgi:hypothetical protein